MKTALQSCSVSNGVIRATMDMTAICRDSWIVVDHGRCNGLRSLQKTWRAKIT